jgi:hypothetical protein
VAGCVYKAVLVRDGYRQHVGHIGPSFVWPAVCIKPCLYEMDIDRDKKYQIPFTSIPLKSSSSLPPRLLW